MRDVIERWRDRIVSWRWVSVRLLALLLLTEDINDVL
jgi:hypothetical protein